MLEPKIRALLVAGLLAGAAFGARPALATAIAHAELSFHDLGITPAVGTVQFTGPWILQAQSSANNSLGEFDAGFDEKDGPGQASTGAAVIWASAGAAAADPAPTPPFLDIGAAAVADGNIPGADIGSAIAQGRGTVRRDREEPSPPATTPPASFFEITGGNAGDPVSVTFSVLINYALSVTTDQYGVLAEAEAIFGQELFGQDVGFVVVNTFNDLLSIGPNDHQEAGATGLLLTNTLGLHYGVRYSLLNEADAEIRVVNIPELDMSTGIAPLALVGLVALWRYQPARARRRNDRR